MTGGPLSFRRPAWSVAIALALAIGLATSASAYPILPSRFWYFSATPGATFDTPTGIAFMPDGRLLVTEKRGRLYLVQDGTKLPIPMWQRENEVLNNGDKGLLDVAVDPDFASNRYIYLLYTVDPDSNGVDDNDLAFGRLTRYQVSATDPNVVDYSTRTILFGRTWAEGPTIGSITHSIGSLRWGADKSLLISVGEGAQFTNVDFGGQQPDMFLPGRANPYEDIGAFRAQYIGSLDGKILRIDPHTGYGYPSNPFYDGDATSIRSRVWCYGLRNPFRFAIRPGTGSSDPAQGTPGTVLIGDVGWGTWEELDIARNGGKNFGWPCYEGTHFNTPYQSASPAHNGCGSTGTPDNPSPFTQPVRDWNHSDGNLSFPVYTKGNSAIGGTFYTGVQFPAAYRGRWFFADYGYSFIKYATLDTSDVVTQWNDFADEVQGPVDLATGPFDGDLYYVSIVSGEVRRLHYYPVQAGNRTPVPVGAALPAVGTAPLSVAFSSAGSSDADGDSLRITWDFGDGSGSFLPNPTHIYTIPGTYSVKLTVGDEHLDDATTTLSVIVNTSQLFPVTGTLDDFNRADGPIGGAWVDPVHGLGLLALSGGTLTQGCCGASSPIWTGASFGPDQEAYIEFEAVTANAPEQSLLLKVHGASADSAHIRVRYDATFPSVQVSTLEPGMGLVPRGAAIPISFGIGDSLGARAYSNGTVQVFRNGGLIGTTSVGGWPWAAQGGQLGLALNGAVNSRLDHFGGGDFIVSANTPPVAVILSPLDSIFYATGDTLKMLGSGVDAQQPADSLRYAWDLTLHHNNHIHPNTFTSSSKDAQYICEQHDDGTGVWLELHLQVTDGGALSSTKRVDAFPEIDLQPSHLTVTPQPIVSTDFVGYSFRVVNHGRMPAPFSHWRLVSGATTIAQGDTMVAALDSVTINVWAITTLPAGTNTLRVKLDTLGTVHETNEANNAINLDVPVTGSPVAVSDPPLRFALANATPNPTAGDTRLSLELPARASVQFRVLDVQGREVWADRPHEYLAGRWSLAWNGRQRDGSRASAGLYLAQVRVDGHTYVRRVAVLR